MNESVLAVIAGAVLFPFVVYLSVKLGTFAFYLGKKKFKDQYGDEDE